MNDASFVKLCALVKSVRDLQRSSQHVLCRRVLMRTWCEKYRPADVPITQIVFPISLRQKLRAYRVSARSVAFCSSGCAENLHRLQKYFYWPAINSDVRKYWASCVVSSKESET